MKHMAETNNFAATQKFSVSEVNVQYWRKWKKQLKCANSTQNTF
jgi:hypothetical protein